MVQVTKMKFQGFTKSYAKYVETDGGFNKYYAPLVGDLFPDEIIVTVRDADSNTKFHNKSEES